MREPVGDGEEEAATSYAFIGAVHRLLDSDRAANKSDLLLAAACQALRNGDLSSVEVLQKVNDIWPGAQTDLASVDAALALGRELRLTAIGAALDGGDLWTLTKEGVEDSTRHEKWLGEVRARALNNVVEKARTGLQIEATAAEAELWLDRLLSALVVGIQSSQSAYLGNVEKIIDGRIIPRGISPDLVLSAIPESTSDPSVTDFLRALAVSAIDPLDPFGNELVSHITTGCVLHSYIAGRDNAAILHRIGSPTGERAVLDTPVLLELIGPVRVQARTETSIRAAVGQGWDAVAAEHSLEEMVDLLEREIPRIQRDFTKALESHTKSEWYAALDQDQLPSMCVEVLRDGTYGTIDEILGAARKLRTRLENIGVTVRVHGNDADQAYVDRSRTALAAQLDERSVKRSPIVIDRDAHSMAMAWRRRRRQRISKWPGAWIITTDRQIGPAYLAVQRDDRVSLTLSPAQWTSLLSVSATPASVVELATAAAGQLVDEAMWLIPARFPGDVALALARQLSPEHGGSDTDVRMAQLTLDDVFGGTNGEHSASEMAAAVLSKRTRRINDLQEQRKRDLEKFAEGEREKAQRASTEAARARQSEKFKTQKIVDLEEASRCQGGELVWLQRQRTRIIISAGLVLVGVALCIWTLLSHNAPAALWSGVGTVATLVGSYRWCTERESKWYVLLVGVGLEAMGLGANLKSLFP